MTLTPNGCVRRPFAASLRTARHPIFRARTVTSVRSLAFFRSFDRAKRNHQSRVLCGLIRYPPGVYVTAKCTTRAHTARDTANRREERSRDHPSIGGSLESASATGESQWVAVESPAFFRCIKGIPRNYGEQATPWTCAV